MAEKKTTAIIIGAGPAGLTAAYTLLKESGIHPVILEADNTVGGISRTVEYHGNRIDIGGHRFFSKSDRVTEFWQRIMPLQGKPAIDDILLEREKKLPADGPDPEKTDRVALLRRRVSRIFYLRKFFDYPLSVKPATFINMGPGRTLKAGMGYLAAMLRKRPEKSLKDFMINRFGEPLYRMFFEKYTEKVWGRNPESIDASWGAQRIRGLSLGKALLNVFGRILKPGSKKVETSLIDEFIYPKKGPGQLWEYVAEDIVKAGGEIILNAEVIKMNLNNGVIDSVTARVNGEERIFRGEWVLSSMPVKDLAEAVGAEQMPEDIYRAAADLPYRDFITAGLLVDKLKLKNRTGIKTVNDIVPDCWIYIQEDEVKIGRLQIFNNWSPYMVADLRHTVWLGLEYFCNENDEMWNMSDEEFIKTATDELVKTDIIAPGAVLDAVRIKIKKAYPAYFGSYAEFGKIRNWLDSVGNLYCIGRNGQHRYNNMDHSMLSAFEAVRLICGNISDKSSLWAVNSEEEYHEEKQRA